MAKSKGRLLSELAEAPKNEDYSDVNALPNTGNKVGDQAFVEETDRLYIWNGSGWYNIALINTTPTWDSGGQPAGSYVLDADSPQTSTTITLAASDPEGIPINYTYVTSGQMDSIATISQDSSVFTITPKTVAQAPDGGTGNITFRASDGVNILPQVSSFTLNFISIIQNSKYTTLLATVTGTSDNNNITDSSSNDHTPTLINPADALKQGSFSPYRSGGYSTYFDGNDYLTSTHTNPLGTADFTVEGWINFDNVGGNRTFITLDDSAQLYFRNSGSSIAIYGITGGTYNFSTGTPEINTWYHFAFVRQSGSITLYWDGQSKGSVGCTDNFNSGNLHIGCWSAISEFFEGHLADIKISSTAVYTSNFYVPTERLSSDSSTQLITCHLPYIADGSNLNETIVLHGEPSVKPFAPYDYLEYDAADGGGSIQSTNSNDTSSGRTGLSFADHADFDLAGSDWTFEWWAYVPKSEGVSNHNFIKKGPQGAVRPYSFNYRLESARPGWEPRMFGSSNGSSQWEGYSGSAWQPWSTWTHVAFVRNGSTTTRYINGKAYGTGTGDVFDNNEVLYVGGGMGDEQPHTYSDLRISKSAVYTAEFTPPTAPLSSTGSVLHLKGTDASIVDKSQGSNLKLIGNTTGSTTQAKFSNTKSMYFDGSGDYIVSQEPVKLGTQDFTAECWLYYQSGLELMGNRTTSDSGGFSVRISSTTLTVGNSSGTGFGSVFSGSTSSLTNAWHHIAVSRSSGVTKIYVDGTSIASHSTSINFSLSNPFVIGYAYTNGSGADSIQGWIQDFRITNGLARYTANFTPPTASLEG